MTFVEVPARRDYCQPLPPCWPWPLPAQAQGLELTLAPQTLPRTPDWKSADLNYESAVRQLEAWTASDDEDLKADLEAMPEDEG